MKSTTTALALLLGGTALAAPAYAQPNAGGTRGIQQTANKIDRENAAQAKQAAQSGDQGASGSTAIKTHTPKVSGSAGKAITALQKAVNAKDAAAIAAAVPAAQQAAKTPDDRYAVAMLQLKAAADAQNNPAIANAIEAMLASGAATQEEKYPLYMNLANTYTAINQPAKAAEAYTQALQLNPSSVEATADLAEAKVAAGQPAEGLALLQKGIALQSANGGRADESWYKRAVAIAYKAKLPQATTLSREWLQAYPSKDAWHDALAIYQNVAPLSEAQTLDLMRLKRATGALTPADYFNYGDIAVRKGFAGEAKAVLDEGFGANLVKRSDPSFSQLYALASKKAQGDKATLPQAPEASANASQTIAAGDAWYGYGEYSKAAEFYRAALAKSGAEPNVANLHLGMALARQGDKAGAVAAFNKVAGDEAPIAKYWLIYAK